MTRGKLANAPQILLIESSNTIRGTVASVCRDLGLARVHQAISPAMGERWLETTCVQGLLLSVEDVGAAVALLSRLRAGEFPCSPDIAVVIMAKTCTRELLQQMKALSVRRLLLQPFKLRDIILTLEQLWPAVSAEPVTLANARTEPVHRKSHGLSEQAEPSALAG